MAEHQGSRRVDLAPVADLEGMAYLLRLAGFQVEIDQERNRVTTRGYDRGTGELRLIEIEPPDNVTSNEEEGVAGSVEWFVDYRDVSEGPIARGEWDGPDEMFQPTAEALLAVITQHMRPV